jgi:hypothetical protein
MKMDKKTLELIKELAKNPAFNDKKTPSTGFPEIDKMIDEKAERIYNALKKEEEE